ncbi:MAG TPA: sigma-70 family RNA polymerase sigma factor, partial [Candidatus Paceibacterota bacterium]|nr:sigma-70 family RNA polymerase sigma factor [Candidatus Paceibacterota bacterium]
IYRFVYLRVNSKEEAQDITSQVFLNFLSKANKNSKLNPQDILSLQAFLYRIARNLVIDNYRHKNQAVVSLDGNEDSVTVPTDPAVEASMEEKQNSKLLESQLSKLKSPYWEVVVWHYIEELDIETIAKILNKTPGNVRVILHRGLNQLKKEVEGQR